MTSRFTISKEQMLSSLKHPAFPVPIYAHFEPHKDDKEVALAAVSKRGDLLQLFNSSLQDDKEVVMEAVTENPRSIRYAGEECCKDKDIARQVLYNDKKADVLRYFSDEIRNDYALIASALPNIQSAGYEIRSDKSLMSEAVKARPQQFGWSMPKLFDDKEYCMMAINIDTANVRNLPENHPLLRDRALALETVSKNHETLGTFKFFHDDPEIIHAAYMREEWEYSDKNPNRTINTNEDSVIELFASERIQNACRGNDPHKALNSLVLLDKLSNNLAPKKSQKLTMKI
ncbi:DUF4116 domain-containing protein [Variovorax sp. RA8]|uniref:DUF4116 domain-containing protein n=1 Tax=Variovorax sp. (strain JCM 16519 / RA8) TaxID=662548 RepID=UPI000A3F556A|nr:DUF4116 domain-containing protein [Variovorax sp. RA8]VTU34411.1 hypothetical protein RA8CHR_04968 [Variovorax sp. RA8]